MCQRYSLWVSEWNICCGAQGRTITSIDCFTALMITEYTHMDDQTAYMIGLSKVVGIGPARMRLLLDNFGSAEAAWKASAAELLAAGLDGKTTEALIEARRRADLDAEMARINAAGVQVLTWDSEDYPERLREVDDAPP